MNQSLKREHGPTAMLVCERCGVTKTMRIGRKFCSQKCRLDYQREAPFCFSHRFWTAPRPKRRK